jgi:predicted TIM-barrel fold metal-dependent hydrolase
MRIVDVHTHAFADDLAGRATPALAEHGGVVASYDGTITGLIGSMDRAGVAVSVVQPVATKPSQVRTINDWAARVNRPDATSARRIVAFGAMHPDFEEPAVEIARMADMGLPGIKMHPGFQEYVPDEPRLRPIYEAARDQGLWMLLHAGGDIVPVTPHGTPETYVQVLDEWPGLKLILAHMGGWRFWEAAAEHIIGRDVYLDTAYTPGHLPDSEFVSLVREHGADRVMFGSDGPWADQATEIRKLQTIGLNEAELSAVLGGNAQRVLGI